MYSTYNNILLLIIINFNQINPSEVYTQDFYEMPGTYRLKENTESETITTDEKILNNFQYRLDTTKKKSSEKASESNSESLCSCTDTIIYSCSDINEPIIGKQGANYLRHGGFSMITQNSCINKVYNIFNLSLI